MLKPFSRSCFDIETVFYELYCWMYFVSFALDSWASFVYIILFIGYYTAFTKKHVKEYEQVIPQPHFESGSSHSKWCNSNGLDNFKMYHFGTFFCVFYFFFLLFHIYNISWWIDNQWHLKRSEKKGNLV